MNGHGNEWNGEMEGHGNGMERYCDRPDPSGSFRRWEMTSLRARDGQIVGSCRDITGPYPYILGKMYWV